MQVLSIENLSLAAEATVILLLLALALPQKKIEPAAGTISEGSVSWEPVKFYYLQTYVHRGLYLQHWRETQNRNSTHIAALVPFIPRQIEEEENQSNIPLPWRDRLTHLLNRHGFDSVLKEWLSIESKHRSDSCLSMITLHKYSEMVSTHGAMVTEQAIQRFASHLALALSDDSLVSRYLPDRFVVLHFASRVAACHEAVEKVQHGISEEECFNLSGHSQSLESIVSIVDLLGVFDVASCMDALEEGTLEAERSGQKIVSKNGRSGTDSPPSTEPSTIDLVNPEVNAVQSEEESHDSSPSVASPTQSDEDDAKTTVANSSTAVDAEEDEPIASSDISAVANSDDVAALFAQINSNKASQSKDAPKIASVSPDAIDRVDAPSLVETPATPVAVDLSQASSTDDISALFASMNPTVAAASTEPKAEVNLSEAATADDIASLFATVKSAVNQEGLDPSKLSPEAEAPEPSLPAGKELSEAASSDDIAALFASIKPANASVQAKLDPVVPLSASTKPDSQSVVMEEHLVTKPALANTVDLSSAASLDDIEALFAAMKK